MPRDYRGCAICDSVNRNFVCTKCVDSKFSIGSVQQTLQELQQEKEVVAARLSELLAKQGAVHKQEILRLELQRRIQQQQTRTQSAQERLAAVKEQCAKLRQDNHSRRVAAERAREWQAAEHARQKEKWKVELVSTNSLCHSNMAMLLQVQRSKLRALDIILPLRVPAIRPGSGKLTHLTVCNLKLPDLMWLTQETEVASAALGYLYLFVELLSIYLGAPTLHEGSFQGSTTVVWQQQSFTQRRPSSKDAILPLHVEEAGSGSISSAISQRVRGSAPAWSSSSNLQRTFSSSSSSSLGSSGGSLDLMQRQRNRTELGMAYTMLLRSISSVCREAACALLHDYGIPNFSAADCRLPSSWGPVGWLALLCALIKKYGDPDKDRYDKELEDLLAAAREITSQLQPVDDQPAIEYLSPGLEFDQPFLGEDEDEDDPVEVDGWDVVQLPFLPPKPSDEEAVEHWTRAHFTDARRPGRQAPSDRLRAALSPVADRLRLGNVR